MFYIRQYTFGPVAAYEVGISPGGKLLKSVYLYIADSVMIDTGPHHLRKQIGKLLSDKTLSSVLLTHHHEDHSGNAALVHKQCKVPVYVHPYGASKLLHGFYILPYQHILFGKAPSCNAALMPKEIETDTLKLTAIHTPGHSKDHTVFYEKNNGWLFSGDLYLGEKIQFFRTDEKIDEQIESLEMIAKLDFGTLFCGHRPCLKKGSDMIARKLDFLKTFYQQVKDLAQKGWSEKEIVTAMQKKSDLPVKLFTMGNASFSHMVKSSLNAVYTTTRN